jgi:UDP-glucose 4-epimerase
MGTLKKNKKILVTGGAGYIGSHTVVELLNAGFTPIIVDNFSNSEPMVIERIAKITGALPPLYKGDVRDIKFLSHVFEKEGEIEGVIHFAALKSVGESVEKPLLYYDNNIRSLLILLEVMERFGVPNIVFSSSASVYGEQEAQPINEDAVLQNPASPYATTKLISEGILRDHVQSDANISVGILRYFNPIGAHPTSLIGEMPLGMPNNLVPLITQVAAGLREKLTVFGDDYDTPDGTGVRDFIHVVDLARAHIAMIKYLFNAPHSSIEVFNVGTGKGTSVHELITTFEKVTGRKLPHEFGSRRPGDIAVCYASNKKITNALNWNPMYTVEDALQHAWNWQLQLGVKNEHL